MVAGKNGKIYLFSQEKSRGYKPQFYEINPTTKQWQPIELTHEDSTFTKRYPNATGMELISNNGHSIRFFHRDPFGIGLYNPTTSTYTFDSIPGIEKGQTLIRGSISDGAQGWFMKISKVIYWVKNGTSVFSPVIETLKPKLDTFKSRLYTNITHEFRTPLTVILGMSEQLTKQSTQLSITNDSKTNFLDKLRLISRNGKNLLSLVNQLLDISKLESGKMESEMVQGDII